LLTDKQVDKQTNNDESITSSAEVLNNEYGNRKVPPRKYLQLETILRQCDKFTRYNIALISSHYDDDDDNDHNDNDTQHQGRIQNFGKGRAG